MFELSGADIRATTLPEVRLRGCELADVEIHAELQNVTVNGVEIAPLIEAELNRRTPERALMRPVDSDGFRAAWAVLERLWAGTVPRDRDARPSLDEVLAVRTQRQAMVREFLAGLTDEQLAGTVTRREPGWPQLDDFPLRECLAIVLNEEWEHRLYAERDLDALS